MHTQQHQHNPAHRRTHALPFLSHRMVAASAVRPQYFRLWLLLLISPQPPTHCWVSYATHIIQEDISGVLASTPLTPPLLPCDGCQSCEPAVLEVVAAALDQPRDCLCCRCQQLRVGVDVSHGPARSSSSEQQRCAVSAAVTAAAAAAGWGRCRSRSCGQQQQQQRATEGAASTLRHAAEHGMWLSSAPKHPFARVLTPTAVQAFEDRYPTASYTMARSVVWLPPAAARRQNCVADPRARQK